MTLGIEAISHYLPGPPVDNQNVIAEHDFDEAFIRDKLGIQSRYFAADDEFASDLAVTACEKLLAATGIDPNAIGLLVVVTQTPDYCLPQVSALVQDRIGFPQTCAAFDINLGCSGYVYGLSTALAMMEAQGIAQGVLVTTETYSKLVSPADRATAPLFGDAATATLLGGNPKYTIGRADFGTDGSRHHTLIARGSGVRRDTEEPLFMDGQAIFNMVIGEIPKSVARCLDLNALSADDIDLWVFHQANQFMLRSLAKRLKIPAEKLMIDMSDTGNTTASTIPIALERQVFAGGSLPARLFLSGFGVGLSWASTVLTATTEE